MTSLGRMSRMCTVLGTRSEKMKFIILLIIIFVVIVPPVYGEMYKWVDEKGTVHFTDDLSSIPEKYRQDAETRKPPKETSTPQPQETPKPSPPPKGF